jgi:Spy/CpxP family protein refolding chaperone
VGLCKTLHSGQAGETRGSHIAIHTNAKEKSMTEPSLPQQPMPRRGRWGIIAAVLAAFVAGSFGTFVTHSFGQGFGPPWMGPMTPAQIEDRADRMVRHLAIEIDATTDQQSKLQGIVKAALNDLLPMREKAFTARQQARDLLTQPSIDRGAIEKLRAEQIATADTASKRIAQALGDAAEVLTPEQRKKINDFLPPPGSHWHWRPWHGWQHG